MNATLVRRAVLFAALPAAIALISGCGSDSTDTASSTAPATNSVATATSTLPTPSASAPAPATAAPATTAQPSPENCATSELSVALGQANGAAGSTELPLIFTNTGPRPCTLDGFPGVSYVSGADGNEVGAAATRTGSGSEVSLAPGAVGTAMVRATNVENYPAEQCGITDVAGLRVYPPNSYDAVFLPYPTKGCSMSGANINQLSVGPVAG